jgi:hypothetical protein
LALEALEHLAYFFPEASLLCVVDLDEELELLLLLEGW